VTTVLVRSQARLLSRHGGRRRQFDARLAAAYTYLSHGWPLLPGARSRLGRGAAPRCTCSLPDCPRPGDHPALDGWQRLDVARQATLDPGVAARWLVANQDAALLSPIGLAFDTLDVPADLGRRALLRMERLGVRLGPVLHMPLDGRDDGLESGQIVFLVAPGTARPVTDWLDQLAGPGGTCVRARGRADGAWLRLPERQRPRPLRPGAVEWLNQPHGDGQRSARVLPVGDQLMAALTYACRHTVTRVADRLPAPRPQLMV
jgi:hypothetical protein